MARRITITLSDELAELAEIRRKNCHYRTLPEYFIGLVRYDGITQKEHLLSEEWAALTPVERDTLDASLLDKVKAGVGEGGSLLKKLAYDAVMEINGAGAKEPRITAVIRKVAEISARRKS